MALPSLIWPKILYFFFFVSLCSMSFLPIFLKSYLQFSTSQIGFLISLQPFVTFFSFPVWTFWADTLKKHKLFLIITPILSCIVTSTVPLVAAITLLNDFTLSSPSFFWTVAALFCLSSFIASSTSGLLDTLVIGALGPEKELYGRQRLWGTIACGLTTPFVGWLLSMTNTTNPSGQLENDYRVMYFVYVFATLIFSILACFSPLGSVTVELKQKEKRLRTRTRSRLPSTTQIELLSNNESLKSSPHFSAELGSSPLRIPQFPITESNVRVRSTTCPQVERPNSTFPSGYSPLPQTSTESSPSRPRNRIRGTSTMNSVDDLIAIPSDDYFPLRPAESLIENEFEITEEPEEPEPLLNTLLVLLSGKIVLVFLFVMLCNGIGNSVISNFYWIYLMDYIGVDEQLLGLTVPFRIMLEIPFFYYANEILRLYSLRTAIILPHITTIIRLLCYSFLPKHSSAWIILPIELFHGISYALFFAAAVQFGAIIAPRGGESTVQSLITGTYATLGGGIGALLGGFLLERTSGFVLWFSTAILIFTSLAIFVIIKVEEFSDKDSVVDELDDENEWAGVRGETEYLRLSQDDEIG